MADSKADKAGTQPGTPAESGAGESHKVLTEGMSQPPGVSARKRRVEKKRRKGPFVKYVGAASHRIIRPPDWKSLGFKGPETDQTHSWDTTNDYLIESGDFTDEQLDYLLIDDLQASGAHSFLEVDYDSDGQLVQVVDE